MSTANRDRAVIFIDVSDSTALYEFLGDEQAHAHARSCLVALSRVAQEFGGVGGQDHRRSIRRAGERRRPRRRARPGGADHHHRRHHQSALADPATSWSRIAAPRATIRASNGAAAASCLSITARTARPCAFPASWKSCYGATNSCCAAPARSRWAKVPAIPIPCSSSSSASPLTNSPLPPGEGPGVREDFRALPISPRLHERRKRRRIPSQRGCSSMVEHQLPKLNTWVRFPSPAPTHRVRATRIGKGLRHISTLTAARQGEPRPAARCRNGRHLLAEAVARWGVE